MAAASPSNIPECSICCENFTTPKFLPCGHTFCMECIEQYIGDKIGTFPCPLCGQNVTIPEGGAKMFATNFIAHFIATSPNTTQVLAETTSPDTTPVIGETTSPDTTPVIGETTSPDTTPVIGETTSPDTTPVIGETSPVTTPVIGETTSPDTTPVISETSPVTTPVIGETTSLDTTPVIGETMSKDLTEQTSSTTSPDTTKAAKQSFSSVKQYCSNHSGREVEFYCINCKTLVCSRCFILQHNSHEFIDIESETAKEEATELVLISEKFIKNKIENLEKTYTALLETSENLKCFGEDTCSRIRKQTEKIITEIREKSETVQTEIRQNIDQTETELTETREKVMEKIKNFKLDLETNLPCLTEDSCVQILVSLSKIKQLEQLCETMKDDTSEVYRYKDWREKNFSVDINMLGSVVTKSYYLHKLNHFRFSINDIEEKETYYYSEDKFTSNDVVWSCVIRRYNDGYIGIGNKIFSTDNHKLDFCIVDRKISLLNIDDDSKTIANTSDNRKFDISSSHWGFKQFISWATLLDKNKGYISSDGQFVVQFDITQVRKVKFKEPS